MSPVCYRYFFGLRDARHGSKLIVDRATDHAARLIFEAIMSAPDLPAMPQSGRI